MFLLLAPLAGIMLSVAAVAVSIAMMAMIGFRLHQHRADDRVAHRVDPRLPSDHEFDPGADLVFVGRVFSGRRRAGRGCAWIMRLNPLTYGMAALRRALYLAEPHARVALPGAALSVGISVVFAAVAMWFAARVAQRSQVAAG